jgi:membrane protease YdiL (CAAX protease family)
MVQKMSNFILGAGMGVGTFLIEEIINYGSSKFQLLPNDRNSFWNEYSKGLKNVFRKVWLEEMDDAAFENTFWKLMLTGSCVVAVAEELLFRFFIQDFILKNCLGKMIRLVSPSHLSLLDGKIGKVFRIVFTSIPFGIAHLIGTDYRKVFWVQAFSAFIVGIPYGLIKESSLGLAGSVGTHVMNNALSIATYYWRA